MRSAGDVLRIGAGSGRGRLTKRGCERRGGLRNAEQHVDGAVRGVPSDLPAAQGGCGPAPCLAATSSRPRGSRITSCAVTFGGETATPVPLPPGMSRYTSHLEIRRSVATSDWPEDLWDVDSGITTSVAPAGLYGQKLLRFSQLADK